MDGCPGSFDCPFSDALKDLNLIIAVSVGMK